MQSSTLCTSKSRGYLQAFARMHSGRLQANEDLRKPCKVSCPQMSNRACDMLHFRKHVLFFLEGQPVSRCTPVLLFLRGLGGCSRRKVIIKKSVSIVFDLCKYRSNFCHIYIWPISTKTDCRFWLCVAFQAAVEGDFCAARKDGHFEI